jgi:hypothetical protein
VVAVDATTLGLAANLAEETGSRSLAAVHLASAGRIASRSMRIVTFDVWLAATARTPGMTVVGA